jgi:hypothetical protein
MIMRLDAVSGSGNISEQCMSVTAFFIDRRSDKFREKFVGKAKYCLYFVIPIPSQRLMPPRLLHHRCRVATVPDQRHCVIIGSFGLFIVKMVRLI